MKQEPFKASTLAEWKKSATMDVTLTSGTRVTLRALTLDELAAAEALPDDLLRVVVLDQMGALMKERARLLNTGKPADAAEERKLAAATLEVRDRIVLAAVVAPKLTAKDVKDLDSFDKEEIAEFAQRRRNVDATGKEVGADRLGFFRTTCRILGRSETDPARKALLMELADLQ